MANNPTEKSTTNVSRNTMPFLVKLYFVEIFKGLMITMRHVLKNIRDPDKGLHTVSYPEQQMEVPVGYRGTHRLTKRDDGTLRCVACYMCSTICPADCIHIEAAERTDTTIEKQPKKFEIDELRCVFCGFCVEVCPCDAIRMDSGEVVLAEYTRRDLILNIRDLTSKESYDRVPLGTHAQGVNPRRQPDSEEAH
jgi:NADH-quinone oxidoreductase subunit I